MAKKYLTIDKFNGGLSTGSRLGIEGSFYWGRGLNFKEDPDAITANMAAVKDSSTTVVDLPKWITSYASDIYAYGNVGKLYKRSSGTWALARTVANSTGQGLELYADYLYYRQDSQIGRYGALSGSPSFTDNWQTSNVQTISDWGAIKSFANLVAFGNGKYLAIWDGATFTYNKITFQTGWHVQDLGVMGEYLVIAVNDNEDVTKARRGFLYFWDGTSSTYNFGIEVMEGGGISSIQSDQDNVFVFPGSTGNIYKYTGKAAKIKRIPFIGEGKTAYIWPGADTNFRGMCYFGLSDGSTNVGYRGVYSWGAPEKNYPEVLNFEYPISTGTVQGTGVKIGAVKAIGNNLYIGWLDGSTYGIDLVSTSTKQTSVVYESRISSLNTQAAFTRFKLFFKPLASGESITLKYDPDQSGSWTTAGSASFSSDGAVTFKLINKEFVATDVQFQVTLAGSSTMPTLTKIIGEYSEEPLL